MAEMKLDISLNPTLDPQRLNAMLAELKKSLGALGADIKPIDTAAWEKSFGAIEQGSKDAADGLKKTGDAAENAGKRGASMLEKFAKFTLVKQVFTDLSSSVNSLAAPFVQLDTATQNLKTLGAEAAAMAPNLREAAISMSRDLPFAAAELQQTMFDALASGVKGGEEGLKSFADTAAKLATGGGSEIGAATGLLAGQLNAYGKSSEEAAKFADVFFNTVNYGVTSIPELSNTLANVVPTAAAAGVEIENVGAALAVMTSKGIPTAQSTTKLNQLLLELQKPAATLAPILEKAGVSLESLRNDSLPDTLKKVSAALKESGVAATQAFSSSEAVAGFNALAGDLAGFEETFVNVRDVSGSAQNAYEQMSDSIEVRTKQMLSTVNSFVIEGLGAFGSGFVGLAQQVGALAPTISTIAGIGSIIPDGTAEKVKGLAGTIKAQFLPTLASMLTSNAAGATSFTVLWSTALAPIAAVVGGIAAVAAAVAIISDLAVETAAEKKEEASAERELLEVQKQSVDSRLAAASASSRQIEQYKELTANTKRTAEEEAKLQQLTLSLAETFPKLGVGVKDSASVIAGLDAEAKKSAESVYNLGEQSAELIRKMGENEKLLIQLDFAIAKDDLESNLADAIDDGFLSGFSTGAKKIGEGDVLGGLAALADSTILAGFGNEISDALFGTSFSTKAAEGFSKGTTDAISTATDAASITTAIAEFTSKVKIDGEKLGLDPKEQAAAIKSMQEFGKKRIAQLEAYKQADANVSTQIADSMKKTFGGATSAGASTAEAIRKISESYGTSPLKTAETVLGDELARVAKNGGSSAENIAKIAKQTGLSSEEAKQLLDRQVQLTAEAEKTATAVASIGKSFADAKKAASEGFQTAFSESLDTLKQIAEAQARGDKAEVERLNQKLALQRQTASTQNAELARLKKIEEQEAARYNPKKLAEIKSREDEITKIMTEATAIRLELARGSAVDETQVERLKLEQSAENAERQVQQEIEDAKKLKIGKDIIAAEKIALENALEEKLRVVRLKNAESLAAFERKLAADALRKQQEDDARRLDDLISAAQANAELLKLEENSQAGSRLVNLEQQGAARLSLLKLQQQKELETLVAGNERVRSTFDALLKATASGNAEQIAAARKAYDDARQSVSDSAEVRSLLARQEKDRQDATIASERAIRAAKIAEIKDAAEQERALALATAEEQLEDRLDVVRGNHVEEMRAYTEFLAKKKAADEKYYRETSDLYLVFSEVVKAVEKELSREVTEEKRQETQQRRDELEQQRDDLLQSLKEREILYSDYAAKLAEIQKQELSILEEETESGFLQRLAAGLGAGLGAAADEFRKKGQTLVEQYSAMLEDSSKTDEEIAKKRNEIFANTAKTALLQFAQLAAQGEITFSNFAAIMLESAYSLLEAQIPIWVAGIFGSSVAELSLGGLVVASGLTAALYGLVAAAKSSLGRATGETRIRGRGTSTSDDNVRLVSVDESIITARGTLARGQYSTNEEVLRYIQSGRSVEDFYRERGISLGEDLGQDADLGRRVDRIAEALADQQDTLQRIAKHVARDNFGERKIALHLKEDPRALTKATKKIVDLQSARG